MLVKMIVPPNSCTGCLTWQATKKTNYFNNGGERASHSERHDVTDAS